MKAIIHFGTNEIMLALVSRGVNNSVVLRELVSDTYSGLRVGEFRAPTELNSVFNSLISRAGVTLDKVFIATPACMCEVTSDEISIPVKGKITARHCEDLLNSVTLSDGDNIVISKTAVYFRVDGGNPCINPVGQSGSRLTAKVSLISVRHSFVDVIKSELVSIVPNVEFVPLTLSSALYLIPSVARDRMCTLIVSETHSTTISVIAGDGVVYSANVDSGIESVISDLCVVKEIERPLATELLKRVVLGLDGDTVYEFFIDGNRKEFSTNETNEIIQSRLEVMCEGIMKAITGFGGDLMDGELYMMGEIDSIKGARNFLSKEMGTNIKQLRDPQTDGFEPLDLILGSVASFVL